MVFWNGCVLVSLVDEDFLVGWVFDRFKLLFFRGGMGVGFCFLDVRICFEGLYGFVFNCSIEEDCNMDVEGICEVCEVIVCRLLGDFVVGEDCDWFIVVFFLLDVNDNVFLYFINFWNILIIFVGFKIFVFEIWFVKYFIFIFLNFI